MRPASYYTDPIAGPAPRSAAARVWWRLKHRARRLLGVRRGFKVDGVYYKETTPELLSRALSRRGRGEKEYRATFPDGTKMLIHCSARRPYADIMGPVVLPHYQRAQAMIRPGMRVLALPCGTGNAVAWLADRVGPSGAVVALDHDNESITYALRRYPRPNVAFEIGDAGALAGEVDGSFTAAFVVQLDPDRIDLTMLPEVWRVVAPGGWVLLACPAETPRGPIDQVVRALQPTPPAEPGGAPAPPQVDWLSSDDEGFHIAVIRKLAG